MGVNQLPLFGMQRQQEPAGWDQSRWPCTELSGHYNFPRLPGSPARGGTVALTVCVWDALLGGKQSRVG